MIATGALGDLTPSGIGRSSRELWSTTASLVVTDQALLTQADQLLDDELHTVEMIASRFRSDSEISAVNAKAGVQQGISGALNDLLGAAFRTARQTGGLVDPTVATAVINLGYDDDIEQVRRSQVLLARAATAGVCPGYSAVQHDADAGTVLIPSGVALDLGATAKAWAADRSAARIHAELGCGVLVSVGGDIAVAGSAPKGGWRIAVAEDHRAARDDAPVVVITAGGLATSSTVVRRWRTSGGIRHHIVDPRTGQNPEAFWRTASAVACSAVDANAATTAAIVLGRDAAPWLANRRVPARLVSERGTVRYLAGWPADAAPDGRAA